MASAESAAKVFRAGPEQQVGGTGVPVHRFDHVRAEEESCAPRRAAGVPRPATGATDGTAMFCTSSPGDERPGSRRRGYHPPPPWLRPQISGGLGSSGFAHVVPWTSI
ncbi:unnamed protein product [Prorocentrum cordatum]|uniref:Uncharacterized protein n=1 Tax=Prorocentrum cordatum TaxID=2364126 RepID=A0ABN9WRE1_9DINO|nr:unnamed protein product [Polarella glacialis]